MIGVLAGIGLTGAVGGCFWAALVTLDPDETFKRYAELKRREKDPALWNAQRMSIVAEKAPELHAEIVRYNAIKEGKP